MHYLKLCFVFNVKVKLLTGLINELSLSIYLFWQTKFKLKEIGLNLLIYTSVKKKS